MGCANVMASIECIYFACFHRVDSGRMLLSMTMMMIMCVCVCVLSTELCVPSVHLLSQSRRCMRDCWVSQLTEKWLHPYGLRCSFQSPPKCTQAFFWGATLLHTKGRLPSDLLFKKLEFLGPLWMHWMDNTWPYFIIWWLGSFLQKTDYTCYLKKSIYSPLKLLCVVG